MSDNSLIDNYQEKLHTFYRRHRRLPSYRELLTLWNYRSTNAVYRRVQKLIEEGVLSRDSDGKLAPAELWGNIRVLGTIAAGFPINAEQEAETMTIDEYLVENHAATYMLTVTGDSMIDAGIQPGDMVIAERGAKPRVGDIVVAMIDGEWTLKYYRLRGNRPYLEAANRKYRPLIPKHDLQIAAVVRGVIRKYR